MGTWEKTRSKFEILGWLCQVSVSLLGTKWPPYVFSTRISASFVKCRPFFAVFGTVLICKREMNFRNVIFNANHCIFVINLVVSGK
jgi:hypothetical protein